MTNKPLCALLCSFVFILAAFSPVHAAQQNYQSALQISISRSSVQAKTGDSFEFETTVSNMGANRENSIVVAMNIVNLEGGSPVDPEDWSPERTQSIEFLDSAGSSTLKWKINAIIKGNYLIYLVAVPKPNSPETTVQPVASQAIHMSVREVPRLNPGGVLPVALGVPIGLSILLIALRITRRRNTK